MSDRRPSVPTPRSAEPSPAIPAATVVLVRDGDAGIETLMLRRDHDLAFAGGAWVFPGGRIDPADVELATDDADPVLGAARHAATRETYEEAGLDVSPEDLVWIAHWMPPPGERRRFSTWFFLAPAPAGEVVIDDGEIRDHRWTRPADALEAHRRAEILLIPPTWMTLHSLLDAGTVAKAMARARAGSPAVYETRMILRDGTPIAAVWAGDVVHDAPEPLLDGPTVSDAEGPRHRLHLLETGWVLERRP